MKLEKFIKTIESLIKHGHQAHEDALNFEDQDHELLKTAEKLIDARHEDKPYRMEFKDELLQKVLKQERAKQGKKSLAGFWGAVKPALNLKALSAVGVVALIAVLLINILGRGPGGEPFIDVINPGAIGGILVPAAHAQDNFELEPETVNALGVISPDTDFVLTSKTEVDKKDLEKYLTIEGDKEFDLEVVEKGYSYRIDPRDALKAGEVLKVSVATVSDQGGVIQPYEYQWVFEVSDHFKVMGAVPGDESTAVALNTAVRIQLSHSNVVDPASYVTVKPDHNVRVEQGFKFISIIPLEPWQTDAIYTVALKKGFGVGSEYIPEGEDPADWQLQEDYVIQFTTGDSNKYDDGNIFLYDNALHSRPGKATKISGYVYGREMVPSVSIEVYKVESDQLSDVASKLADVPDWLPGSLMTKEYNKLLQAHSFDQAVQEYEADVSSPSYYGGMDFQLRSLHEAGVYLVSVEFEDNRVLFLWSVTNVGAYVAVSETSGLVWVVDISQNQPISGASVFSQNQNLGKTDKDGVVSISAEQISSLENKDYVLARYDDQMVVLPISFYYQPEQRPEYKGFLFADQNLVHPDDTIRFWGLIQRKDKKIQEVEVELGSTMFGYGQGKVISASDQLTVDENGFFEGEFELKNLRSGWYNLNVKDGENYFKTLGLEVKEFTTPEISINLTTPKQRLEPYDSNRVDINAAYFDDVPAAYLELALTGDVNRTIVTDENGNASIEVESPLGSCGSYGCSNDYMYVEAKPVIAKETEIIGRTSWLVTQNYLDYEFDHEEGGDKIVFSAGVKGIEYLKDDTTKLSLNDTYVYHAAAGVPYRAKIVEVSSGRSELVTDYDSYTNQTRYYYSYADTTLQIDYHEGLTDLDGNVSIVIPRQENKNYRVEFEAMDRFERYDKSTHYIRLYNFPYGRVYVSGPEEEPDFSTVDSNYDYKRLSVDIEEKDVYNVGEKVKLEVGISDRGFTKLSDDSLSLIYTLSPNIIKHYVIHGAETEIELIEDYQPNMYISAAAVSGNRLYYMDNWWLPEIQLNSEPNSLDVDIVTSKEQYSIRDDVEMTVHVKDKNGSPVKAKVNIKALDKAYVELDDASANQNPLDALWVKEHDRLFFTAGSHDVAEILDGRGGGGDGDVRQEFAELAHYEIVETDNSGMAKVTMSLPDNLTTWIISASAATPELQGGVGQAEIVVSQPLRVDVVQSDSYIAGDEIVISAKAASSNLTKDDEVEYSLYGPKAHIEGNEYGLEDFPVASQTRSAVISEVADFELGDFEAGEYVYAIRAKAGDYQDVLVKRLEIIAGRGATLKVDVYSVDQGWKAPQIDTEGRVNVRLSSAIGAEAYNELNRIYYAGARLDHQVAVKGASKLLEHYFGQKHYLDRGQATVGTEYKSSNGGYALFPYGSSDIVITSLIMTVIDEDDLPVTEDMAYFNRILANENATPDEVALAFRGLAALDQPGLAALRKFVSRDDLNLTTRLNNIDALLLYGDQDLARQLWNSVIEDAYKEKEGLAWLDDGNAGKLIAQMQIKEWTELAMINAVRLGDDKYLNFERHLKANSEEPINPIQRVRYWEARLKQQPVTEMSFVVKLGEQESFVGLKGFQTYAMDLTTADLEQLELIDVKGNVSASLAYETMGQVIESSPVLTVERHYWQGDRFDQEVDPNLDVEVVIDVRLNDLQFEGAYVVEDILPSGLKTRTRGYGWDYEWGSRCERFPYQNMEHESRTIIWLSDYCQSYRVRYKARPVANGGKYLAEGVTVTSGDFADIKVVTKDQWIEIIRE